MFPTIGTFKHTLWLPDVTEMHAARSSIVPSSDGVT
jgi:hypothetical protein